jgi:hypothetical protein
MIDIPMITGAKARFILKIYAALKGRSSTMPHTFLLKTVKP